MGQESNEFAIRGSTSRQNIEAKAQRYTESAQSLLDDLQALCRSLEGQMVNVINVVPFGGSDYTSWSVGKVFDYAGTTSSASEMYEAWLIARRSNKVVAEFGGKSLQAFVSLFTRLDYQPMASDGFPEAGTIAAAENLMTAVYRLELLLLLKPEIEEAHLPDLHAAEVLPFQLERCDVSQTLKRAGYRKPVIIKNDDYWKLMEALLAASPDAIPESKLKHLFQNKSDRDNAPKKLRGIIDSLGLTVKNWALMELDT